MKIYNDYMNDLCLIILYEFLQLFQPMLIHLVSIMMCLFSIVIYKCIYIPFRYDLNLKKVVILIDSKIIFSNTINLNYYHLKIIYNNNYIDIRGNNRYILYNHNIFFRINDSNFTFNLLPYTNSNMSLIRIDLPVKKYELEDCCICYDQPGQINGLCGHQIICSSCVKDINSCPICNSKIIENTELLEKILYI
jgi:hypothetical protein